MKQAGCIMLGIGVESGSQRIIESMKKQQNPKPWLDQCRQVFRWTRHLGLGTNAYYIIGNPTEMREEIEQTIAFALELDSDSIQVHFYTPYPGSAAGEMHKDQQEGDHIYVYYPLTVEPAKRNDLRQHLLRKGFDTKTSDMADCTALKPFQNPEESSNDHNARREASILEICVYPVIAGEEMHRLADTIRVWAGLPKG